MITSISRFLKNYSKDIKTINRLLVTSYVSIKNLNIVNNNIIRELLISEKDELEHSALTSFIEILNREYPNISIEHLIELFEFVISPSEKEVNGAVYTPESIRRFIVTNTLRQFPVEQWENLTIADISCGCGGFFTTALDVIREHINISCYSLIEKLYGIDIASYSIDRTRILLSLYAIEKGEDYDYLPINLYNANSLTFDWNTIETVHDNGGFDVIIGNPPYVSSSKISQESKDALCNWSVTRTGKTDLYIPFFQIALECLNDNGILGYITVNNFYRSVNGRAFRAYVSYYGYDFKIIDFGAEQVFKGRSTYTCICIISKNIGDVKYVRTSSSSLSMIEDSSYTRLPYNMLDNHEGWLLQSLDVASNIKRIESCGKPLGKVFNIKNGFATLKNEVYVLNVVKEDQDYYYTQTKKGEVFKIERLICRDVIKPNTLKNEIELNTKIEKLIFPYTLSSQGPEIIPEDKFKNEFPMAYEYLLANRETLKKRDKGTREYDAWYAFGRTQALNISGYKLLFPYIADAPYFVISENKELLFYNGYALVSDDLRKLQVAQKILQSKVFWYYIKNSSKPYGGDYYALAKNYVKDFGYISLSDKEEEELLNMKSDEDINNFLKGRYNITLEI